VAVFKAASSQEYRPKKTAMAVAVSIYDKGTDAIKLKGSPKCTWAEEITSTKGYGEETSRKSVGGKLFNFYFLFKTDLVSMQYN